VDPDRHAAHHQNEASSERQELDYFDAVFFMTTGELPLNEEQKAALLSFVRDDGKGSWRSQCNRHAIQMARVRGPDWRLLRWHPWMTFKRRSKSLIRISRYRAFPADFQIVDEIYQTKQFDPSKVRVLMTLDTSKVDMKRQGSSTTACRSPG